MEIGRVPGKPESDQAAELELLAALDVAGFESEDEEFDDEESEDELDGEPEAEPDGFEAGELLDDAPRLSLR